MTFLFKFLQMRLKIFYIYFRRVMGGQVIIALINTLISAVVIFALDLHHPFLMIFVVFFCGLFPVVGNLMSNSVLTINAFVSTGMWGTVICLIMLVGVHKLGVHSKFQNNRRNRQSADGDFTGRADFLRGVLLGIPGLILAIPLVLFVRHEFEHIRGLAPGLHRNAVDSGPMPARAPSADLITAHANMGTEEISKPVSKVR